MRGFALPASPLTRPSRFSRASNCPSKRRNMFIDSHCHLNYKGLVEDQQNVLERARGAGVGLMLNIATRESEWDDVLYTALRPPVVWETGGIHPDEGDEHPHADNAILVERARSGDRRVGEKCVSNRHY